MGKKEVIYLAIFEPDPDVYKRDRGRNYSGPYGVYFPDVLGCASYGEDFAEAKEMAHEALQLHLDWMVRDGDEIPESTLRVSEEDLEDGCIAVGIKVLLPL